MYAVIEDSGRQFKVTEGESIAIDLRATSPGEAIEFDRVLFFSSDDAVYLGSPWLQEAKVVGEVEGEFKDKKVVSYKFRRRKSSAVKKGHRQRYLRVRIKEIRVPQNA